MKRIILSIILLVSGLMAHAQADVTVAEQMLPEAKSFGGFLIDMTLMNLQAPPRFSDFKLEVPDASRDYSRLFRLNPNVTYSKGSGSFFSTGLSPWSPWRSHTSTTWQMGSFKLKNGMRLNTYGQYNQEGRKVHDPSALPWQRNDYKGAFELKSANGAFGFRIEVQHNR